MLYFLKTINSTSLLKRSKTIFNSTILSVYSEMYNVIPMGSTSMVSFLLVYFPGQHFSLYKSTLINGIVLLSYDKPLLDDHLEGKDINFSQTVLYKW